MADKTIYLESKPRYEILDGLRGVAAIMVVLFHLIESYGLGYRNTYINHGYLAVDFFFALSGFVIGYAYDDRWGQMTVGGFFKRRLTRLHPMLLMGVLVGILFFYFSGGETFDLVINTPWWQLLLCALACCFLIPLPSSLDIRGWGETSAVDGPSWTLMFEYIANILYALVIRRFSKFVLGLFLAFSAVMTIDVCFNLDLFGIYGDRDCAYTLIGGFTLDANGIYTGFTRLLFPFFMGLMIFRIGRYITLKGGFWWTALITVAILAMPHFNCADWMEGAYNAACAMIVFPLMVAAGAGSRITDPRTEKICRFLGDISFPLYITHYPLIYTQMSWVEAHRDLPLGTHIVVGISTLVLAFGIAYASLKLYDQPVREWLKDHWLKRNPSGK